MGLFTRDLILLHPPSVYDFRSDEALLGPVSDVVPSSPVFEMYPMGLTSIAHRLETEGFNVTIVNVAYRMLRDPGYDAAAEIARLEPKLFGIDLHWLPHAHGALELARIVKEAHPEIPLIMGGLSASYYWEELIRYPFVDLVMRGDSTEEPMLALMRALRRGSTLTDVPNLVWKDEAGRVVDNGLTHVPSDIDGVSLPNIMYVIRSVFKYGSLANVMPYVDWLDYPMTALLTSRGCSFDCAICGGSRSAYRQICNRTRPAFRSPEALVRDIREIRGFSRAPIMLLNDVRQGGAEHAARFLELLARERVKNELIVELFFPVRDDFFERLAGAVPHFSVEITLESHKEEIRRLNGKLACSNEEIEATIAKALAAGVNRVDLFFMVGLPKQSYADAVGCVDYCRSLLERFRGDRRLWFFVAPLAPFLDPGSRVFEAPEQFGVTRRWRTLEEHRQALAGPTWKHILNYETDAMTRDQIVDATYEAALRLALLKWEYGSIDVAAMAEIAGKVAKSRSAIREVDAILALPEGEERTRRLEAVKRRARELRAQPAGSKEVMKWPIRRRFRSLPRLGLIGARLLGREVYLLLFKRLGLMLAERSRSQGTPTAAR